MVSCAASLCTSEMVFGPSTACLSTQAFNLRSMTSCRMNQAMSGHGHGPLFAEPSILWVQAGKLMMPSSRRQPCL